MDFKKSIPALQISQITPVLTEEMINCLLPGWFSIDDKPPINITTEVTDCGTYQTYKYTIIITPDDIDNLNKWFMNYIKNQNGK